MSLKLISQSRWSRRGKLGAVCAVLTLACGVAGYLVIRSNVRGSERDTVRIAERHIRRRNNEAARDSLKWLLWFEPKHDRALLLRAVSLNADRMFAESIETLDRIPKTSASYTEARIALVSSLVFDGRLERAENEMRGFLAEFPQVIETRKQLLLLYLRQFRKRDARNLLMDQWQRFPDDLSVLPYLLDLEARIVTAGDRVDYLETADEQHPNQAPVVLSLARAYALMGKGDEASERFQAAIALRPFDPVTRLLAAEFQLDEGKPATARKLLNPDNSDMGRFFAADDRFWFLQCRVEEQSGSIQDAYKNLQRAIEIRSHDETYLLKSSSLLRRLGRSSEATTSAKVAVELADARNRLLVLSQDLDRNRPARKHCLEIADLLERLGHVDQAEGWRRIGHLFIPDSAEASHMDQDPSGQDVIGGSDEP